jgi:polar amino acid transport system substrate-binding protein
MFFDPFRPVLTCLVICIIAMAGVSVHAANEEPSVVKVCYEAWAPYIFRNENGQIQGISVELLDSALAVQGLSTDYKELPFKRCIADIHKGEFDIAIPISTGHGQLHDTDTVFAYWTLSAIVPEDSEFESPVSLAGLLDATVILISGYSYPEKMTRWAASHPRIIRVTYSSDGQGLVPFHMLDYGRADVFIEDKYWSEKLIEQNGLSLKVLEPALDSAISVAGFRPELEGLRDRVDEYLQTRSQDFRDSLFLKYTGFPEAYFSGQYQQAANH